MGRRLEVEPDQDWEYSSTTYILSPFPASAPTQGHLNLHQQVAGTGLSRSIGSVEIYPSAKEQMFTYLEEVSGT